MTDEQMVSERHSVGNLAKLWRVPNQMNSVLDGLSCNLREAYEFARSVTQDERRVTRDEAAGVLDSDRRIVPQFIGSFD